MPLRAWRHRLRGWGRFATAGVVLAASLCAVPAFAAPDAPVTSAHTEPTAVGLTKDQRLVEFHVDQPDKTWSLGKLSGLSGDKKLVGIDFRVQNERLYGVGDKGGVYTLNTKNAKAAKVSQLTVALSGKSFGVDFNPAANRLRVISDTGQNLRHNIDDPAAPRTAIVDGTLTNSTTPPSTAMGVTGAAYTSNGLNAATATTLFDLDTMADRVSLQSPANAGTLAPTGNLGVNADLDAGFDIYYSPATGTNHGFAAIAAGGSYRLYRVNILSGKAGDEGSFPKRYQVTDLALPIDQR
ncbi:DUF4394 domain-containing protein [Streptomyces sp. NPDC045251]|uniref:DUF4394 domain-containing protein n=1 Tax=unclassified Streptomyces TaxID=2593676 RepID=UPI0034055C9B